MASKRPGLSQGKTAPSFCHGKVTILRGPAESCEMNIDATPAPFSLQDSAAPRQIMCDLPMTQRGPADEAGGLQPQN